METHTNEILLQFEEVSKVHFFELVKIPTSVFKNN